MNIHPLFVHFPIGILVLYTAFEILRFKILTRQAYYFPLKAILVIAGTLTGLLTLSTGEMAEHIVLATEPGKKDLIEMHAMFGGATITLYAIIAGYYLAIWLKQAGYFMGLVNKPLVLKLVKIISPLVIPLSVVGLVTITITGGLGASIVYGPEVDPFVTFIYHLFF